MFSFRAHRFKSVLSDKTGQRKKCKLLLCAARKNISKKTWDSLHCNVKLYHWVLYILCIQTLSEGQILIVRYFEDAMTRDRPPGV